MSRRGQLSWLSVALIGLAGCGGSSHSGASTASTTTIVVGTGSTAVTMTTTTPSHRHRSRTHHRTTPPPATTSATTSTSAPAPAARVPALYKIAADGTLTPPTVSAPAGYNVQLTFVDRGVKGFIVVIHTRTPLDLAVPPGGKSYGLLKKPPKGTYGIDVNGQHRGSLVIGSSPGP